MKQPTGQGGFAQSMTLLLIVAILLVGLAVAWPTVKDAVISELVDTAGSVDSLNQSYSYAGLGGHSVAGTQWSDAADAGQTADPPGGFGRGVSLIAPKGELPPVCADFTFPAAGFAICCGTNSPPIGATPGCSAGTLQPIGLTQKSTCLRRNDPADPTFQRPSAGVGAIFAPGLCLCAAGHTWYLFPGESCPPY